MLAVKIMIVMLLNSIAVNLLSVVSHGVICDVQCNQGILEEKR